MNLADPILYWLAPSVFLTVLCDHRRSWQSPVCLCNLPSIVLDKFPVSWIISGRFLRTQDNFLGHTADSELPLSFRLQKLYSTEQALPKESSDQLFLFCFSVLIWGGHQPSCLWIVPNLSLISKYLIFSPDLEHISSWSCSILCNITFRTHYHKWESPLPSFSVLVKWHSPLRSLN